METWWISPALVALGIILSVALGLRRDAIREGRQAQEVSDLKRESKKHADELGDLRTDCGDQLNNHERRISRIEGHLRLPVAPE